MKTDARKRYTRRALRQALLQCLEEKPISAITVKAVCEKAEINRATFYQHYRDCFDLLEQMENEMLEEYRLSLEKVSMPDATALVNGILDMMDKNADLCRLLIARRRDDSLLLRMIAMARASVIGEWRAKLKKASDQEVDMLLCCLTHGLFQVVVEQYGQCSREDLTAFVNRTVLHCLRPYMADRI